MAHVAAEVADRSDFISKINWSCGSREGIKIFVCRATLGVVTRSQLVLVFVNLFHACAPYSRA
jgi:hypothetical protein